MGFFSSLFGGSKSSSNSNYQTVKVKGPANSGLFHKNADTLRDEKIIEMDEKGYDLVSCTGRYIEYNDESFLGSFMSGYHGSDEVIEYTMMFKKKEQ